MTRLLAGLAASLIGSAAPVAAQAPLVPAGLDRWSAEIEVRIGSVDDPDAALDDPLVLLGPDERVYAIERRLGEVRVYEPDGVFSHTFGRHGRGPGEFTRPASAGFVGDTLWIFDAPARRITRFDLEGRYIDDYSFSGSDDIRQPMTPVRIRPDGTHRAVLHVPGHRRGRFTSLELLADRDGNILEVLDSVAVVAPAIHFSGGLMSYQPVRDDPLVISEGDASTSLVIDRRAPRRRDRGELRIARVAAGDTLLTRTFTYDPQPLSPARRDSLMDHALDREPGRGVQPERDRAIREQLYLPRYLPPVTAARRSSDGSVWLRRELLTDARPYWIVLDPDLRPRARVSFPIEPERILRIRDREVWATVRDELDVPYVVRYRIDPED